MDSFETISDGRVHVHMLRHSNYRTKEFSIRLHTPIRRDRVTATALLPHMWMNGTDGRPSTTLLTIAADDLYGTLVRSSLGKRGGKHILQVDASIPDVTGLTEESVVDRAIDLACDVLFDHTADKGCFSAPAVAQEIDLHRRRIEAARDDKMSYALQRCLAHVAENTPAALPRLGYLDDLPQLTPATLFDVYLALLETSEIHAYLVGPYADLTETADKLLAKLRGILPKSQAVRRDSPSGAEVLPRKSSRSFQKVTERQDVAQAQLDIAYRTGIGFGDDRYPALLILNGVFGGFTHSKLFLNVREKHSLAYTVWSHLDLMTGVLAVMTGISPDNYDKAVDIVEQQLEEIRAGKISDAEMEFTVRALENQYTLMSDGPAALANWHYTGVLSGAARDVDQLIQDLRRVGKDDLVQVAQEIEPSTIYFLTREEGTA